MSGFTLYFKALNMHEFIIILIKLLTVIIWYTQVIGKHYICLKTF